MQKILQNYHYLLKETALILGIAYLYFFGSSKFSLISPEILTIDVVFFVLLFFFLLVRGIRTSSRIDLPLAVMMAVMLATSLSSIDPRRSLAEFWLVGLAVTLYFVISELVALNWEAELIYKAVLIVGSILMGLAWFEAFQWYSQWLSANPGMWTTISFRLSNPNFLAVMFNVWLMISLARLIVSKSLSGRIFLSLYILSAAGLLILTSSRGGWLGTAAGLLCLIFFLLQTKRSIFNSLWNLVKNRKFLFAIAGLLLCVFLAVIFFILYRQMFNPTHGSRTEIWLPAINGFLSSPLWGKGPFTFVSLYLAENSVPPYLPFDYAHSIYLDLLSGTGLIGLASFLWLITTIFFVLWRQLKIDSKNWAILAGALAAMTAFLAHGFVDSVHHTSPTSLWNLVIVVGTAISLVKTEKPATFRSSGWKLTLIALSLILVCLDIWRLIPLKAGVDAANKDDWATASEQFELAEKRDGTLAIAAQQKGIAYSMLIEAGNNNLTSETITAFERTVQLDPFWALNHANLGVLYQFNHQYAEACSALKQAVKLAPGSDLFQLNLGRACEDDGDLSTAELAYHKVLDINPAWVQAYFWRSNVFRKQVQESWLTEQPVQKVRNIEEIIKAISGSPENLRLYLELANAEMDQDNIVEAEKALKQAELLDSYNNLDWLELDWQKARLSAAKGDKSTAVAAGEKVLNNYLNHGISGPGTMLNPSYAVYMYRRPAVNMDIIPQMDYISLPDQWGFRVAEIAQWYQESGNTVQSRILLGKLHKLIPDFEEIAKNKKSP